MGLDAIVLAYDSAILPLVFTQKKLKSMFMHTNKPVWEYL